MLPVLHLSFWTFWNFTWLVCKLIGILWRTHSRHPGSRCLVLRRDIVRNARGVVSIWRSWGSKELPQNDQRNHLIHLPFPSVGYHSLLQLLVRWIWKQCKNARLVPDRGFLACNTPSRIMWECLQTADVFCLKFSSPILQRYSNFFLSCSVNSSYPDLQIDWQSESFWKTLVWLKRITIPEIKQHPWFLKNLPREISEREKANFKDTEAAEPAQAVDEIMRIVQEAKTPGDMSKVVDPALLAEMAELESEEEEADPEETYWSALVLQIQQTNRVCLHCYVTLYSAVQLYIALHAIYYRVQWW